MSLNVGVNLDPNWVLSCTCSTSIFTFELGESKGEILVYAYLF